MKKSLIALAIVSTAAMAASASASLLVADGFNYTVPSTLSGNTDTDFAANPAQWALTGAADAANIVAGNVTYPGSGAPAHLPGGNSVQLTTSGSIADRIQLATPATNGVYSDATTPNTTLYYSFTMNTTDLTGMLTTAGGGFIAGFNNSVGSDSKAITVAAGALCIRTDDASGTTYQLGIAQNPAGGAPYRDFASGTYSTNDPLFIVAAYNLGAAAGDDTADLYIFDGANNDAIPASQPGTATVSSPYNREINASVDNLSSFFLRPGTGNGTISVDDVRVGTTWADVTTAVPEPASLSLLGLGAIGLLARRRRSA